MSDALLQVKNLSASIEEGEILHHIDLEIAAGETHVLLGPNGAGNPPWAIPSWAIPYIR